MIVECEKVSSITHPLHWYKNLAITRAGVPYRFLKLGTKYEKF